MTRTQKWDMIMEKWNSFEDLQQKDLNSGDKERWKAAFDKMYGFLIAMGSFYPEFDDDISTFWMSWSTEAMRKIL